MILKHLVPKNQAAKRCYSTAKQHLKNELYIQPKFDYTRLVKDASMIEKNMQSRNYDKIDMGLFAQLNQQRLDLYKNLVSLKTKRNDLSLATRAITGNIERAELIQQGKQLKLDIKSCEEQLNQTETQLFERALMIPNNTHENSPIGSEENARIIKVIGNPSKGQKDHVSIASDLNILDLEQAAITSGSSFYYLQGMGAFLELALIQYAMQKAASRGFMGVLTPDIVRTQVAYGCGFQPRRGESSQIYDIATKSSAHSGLCLAGTAEIPLAGKFATKTLNEQDLPQRLVGFGHAFRTEAGGRGLETKGLYRVHQFSKVELFAVTTPGQSEEMMEEIKSLQEEMFTELGLCFRILDMPTEELGASAYRKYDMEAWMPGRAKWGEISSTSNCTDYQSRRLSIRYRPKYQEDNNTQFCHTLNGTAIAVPRVIIAILETFQQENGSVRVPEVLRKWLPGEPEFLRPASA
ncbi:hypothetical protein [Parasitella parasitica]|uniref:serine--tRNA ligase n=1 Tax=Parasitella parasitica TaxID=35722 RepID=A0A0B7NFS6_9FUNG|nr:hypothetical protein [Parasitella parasitica]